MGFDLKYQNHSQGNFSNNYDNERIASNQMNDYAYYMRHPMNMHSQMMPPAYSGGYHLGMPFQSLLSQPISNFEMMNMNRSKNISPNIIRYDDKTINSTPMTRSLLHSIPSQNYDKWVNPQMQMRVPLRVQEASSYNRTSPSSQTYFHQVPNHPYTARSLMAHSMMNNSQRHFVERKENLNDNTDNSTPEKLDENLARQPVTKNESSTTASSDNDIYSRFNWFESMNNFNSEVELSKNIYPYLNSLGIDAREYISNHSDLRLSEVNKWASRESRGSSGVYYPDDKPVLQNIVSTCNLWWKLDLSMIAMKAK